MARRERRTPAEMAALLLEEKVRERMHPLILFRDTAVGRQASVRGTRLLVWHVMTVARDLEMDPVKVAEHLQWPVAEIQARSGMRRTTLRKSGVRSRPTTR